MNKAIMVKVVLAWAFVMCVIVFSVLAVCLSPKPSPSTQPPSTQHVCYDTVCSTGWLKDSCSCDKDQVLEVKDGVVVCRCKEDKQ